MKKLLALTCAVFALPALALAEPFVLEQAGSVSEAGILEIGLGEIGMQTDLIKFDDGSKLTNNATSASVFTRYAFSESFEGTLSIPYLMLSYKGEPASGGASSTDDDAGLGDVLALLKYNFSPCSCGWDISAGLGLSLPTGKQSTKFPEEFRNGLNLKPIAAATKKYDKCTLNANLSYNITAEYEDASAAKVKQNPGDVLSLGVGVEYPKGEKLNLIGEFIYSSKSEAKSGGVASSGSAGSLMDLVMGLRYNKNSIKTKLGVALAIGDEKYRTYDYKIVAGLTYLWKI